MVLADFGLAGRFGSVMGSALFGTFGLMAYALPFVLFFGFAFFLANRRNALIFRKITGLILMFLFLSAFLQLLTMGYTRGMKLKEIYRLCMEERNGGGIVGGAVTQLFGYAFGTIGAYVLTSFGLVAAAIIMTQKPLLTGIGQRGRRAAMDALERRQIRQAERDEERKERQALEKLRRTEEQIERDKRIREIEKEAEMRERARSREAGAYAAYREPVINADENPLDRVTLERPEPGNITQIQEYDLTKKKTSAPKRARPEKAPAAPAVPPLPEPYAEEPADSFSMPAFLSSREREAADFFSAAESGGLSGGASSASGSAAPSDGFSASGGFSAGGFGDTPGKEPGTPVSPEADDAAERAKPSSGASGRTGGKSSGKKAEAGGEDNTPVSVDAIRSEIQVKTEEKPAYRLPSVELLTPGKAKKVDSERTLMTTASKLQQTLQDFGVNVKVVNVSRGPTVTRYELQPEQGVKVSRIINLQDDIKLNLATSEIRIEAPIPGKAAVGIEVPNREIAPVMLRELIDSPEFRASRATLAFAVGKDIGGRTVIADIEKMPHLLIAGATGSGKSVCINTLIMSILFKATPDQVKMLMIDPKVVELKIYDGIPHLLIPVVTDAKKAAGALNWAVSEMTDRYNKFAQYPGVRDIRSYNQRIEKLNAGLDEKDRIPSMPRIVVIVDELADLMMVASSEVEDAICRLAQLARAAGIHLIIATQRPSVNVVTGLIKANMPSRIALAVTSGVDSRTILDMNGAEKLLGKGDMLFYPQGYPKPARVQGAFVSDEDITEVVKFLSSQSGTTENDREVEEQISSSISGFQNSSGGGDDERDEYFADSGRLIIEKDKASIGMLQRAFKIGFNRAARIMDQLSDAGVVGSEEGTKPRKILMTKDEFEELLASGS